MKKIIMICSLLMSFMNLNSAVKYSIYFVEGHVEVNINGWHDAKKHEEVNLQSEFKIYKGGKVVIADHENGLTFSYNNPTKGKFLLRDMIRESKSNSAFNLISLIKDLFTLKSKQKLGYRAIGGVTLGTTNSIEKDLSDMIINYAFTKKGRMSDYVNNSLILSKVKRDNGLFTFNISNQSDDDLYVNIVAYNSEIMRYTSPLDLLISNSSKTTDGLYLFLPSHDDITLDLYAPEWLFAKCNNVQYCVFGSTCYFENHSVVELLINNSLSCSNVNFSSYSICVGVNK